MNFPICIHRWSAWLLKTVNAGYYDEERWQERHCEKCGKVEQKEIGG